MKEKKRKEFETWYATELARNDEYVLWDELNKYCRSDVMVLKAACLKFIQEFKEEAGFNPIEKCATIASACNLFWRRDPIPEDTIAIEPLNGWRGANVNQCTVALEWLCFEHFKLGGNKLRHVRNGGEEQCKEGLFADYVGEWLKDKTEASGWSKNCTTESAKSEYINAYYDREGVHLEPEKVAKNGGRKQVAKLMLNR